MEHELGLTTLFNNYLAEPANAVLNLVGVHANNPARPWEDSLVMELLVVAILMVAAVLIRTSLSAENPGGLQHVFESIYGFIAQTARDAGVEQPAKFLAYFATIFIFIVSMNLIGIIPAFASPTMSPWVPAGLAVWTFLYFNFAGFSTNGLGYLKHFAGPIWWLAPFMFTIEMISNFIRPLSLTVRLYGNMYAGEQVTLVFLGLTKLVVPVIFMALHVFVSLIQAYVFTILTMIYIAGATAHGHGEGHGKSDGQGGHTDEHPEHVLLTAVP
ncbi:MAG: F0F1 ATP synthase subunit A [Acidobacteriota bacterium]